MSKYVEMILRNKYEIESNLSLEDDEYNDLLIIEMKIKELELPEKDVAILSAVAFTGSYQLAGKILKKSRTTVAKHFRLICERIGKEIGEYFIDENYPLYLKQKYKLTADDYGKLCKYLGENN